MPSACVYVSQGEADRANNLMTRQILSLCNGFTLEAHSQQTLDLEISHVF